MRIDGEKMKTLRLGRFLTQVDLANAAGITESTIVRLERGLQEARISTVKKIAASLGVEPSDLLFMGERERPQDSS